VVKYIKKCIFYWGFSPVTARMVTCVWCS